MWWHLLNRRQNWDHSKMNLRCPKPIFQLFRKISERRPQTFHTTSFVPLLRIKFISYNNNLANGSDQMLKIRKKYFFFHPTFQKNQIELYALMGGGQTAPLYHLRSQEVSNQTSKKWIQDSNAQNGGGFFFPFLLNISNNNLNQILLFEN